MLHRESGGQANACGFTSAQLRFHAAVLVAGLVMSIAVAAVVTHRNGELALHLRGVFFDGSPCFLCAALDVLLGLRGVFLDALSGCRVPG